MLAGLVPQGARAVDVGTDHGLLALELISGGRAASVIATDIKRGPLGAAEKNAEKAGIALDTRLCDGLAGVTPDECDAVVIAGMGGETISEILAAAPWTKNGSLLLLQPMTRASYLRRFLYENGYETLSEHLVCEGGKFYCILAARGGQPRELIAGGHIGQFPATGGGHYGTYLRAAADMLRREAQGLSKAENRDERRISEIETNIQQIDGVLALYDDNK